MCSSDLFHFFVFFSIPSGPSCFQPVPGPSLKASTIFPWPGTLNTTPGRPFSSQIRSFHSISAFTPPILIQSRRLCKRWKERSNPVILNPLITLFGALDHPLYLHEFSEFFCYFFFPHLTHLGPIPFDCWHILEPPSTLLTSTSPSLAL